MYVCVWLCMFAHGGVHLCLFANCVAYGCVCLCVLVYDCVCWCILFVYVRVRVPLFVYVPQCLRMRVVSNCVWLFMFVYGLFLGVCLRAVVYI